MSKADGYNSRHDLLEYLFSTNLTSQQAILDVVLSESKSVAYLLDLSAIHGGVWKKGKPENLFEAVTGQLYDELIIQERQTFVPSISSPTFIELLFEFHRRIENHKDTHGLIEEKVKQVKATIKELDDLPISGNSVPITTSMIHDELHRLKDITGMSTNDSLQRANELFKDHVCGFGDIAKGFYSNIVISPNELDELLERMFKFRSRGGDTRPQDEKEFRYTIDAINVLTTERSNGTQDEVAVRYVTKGEYSTEFIPKFGRTPVVPILWSRLDRDNDFQTREEIVEFIEGLAKNSEILYNRIFRRIDLPVEESVDWTMLAAINSAYMQKLGVIHDAKTGELETDHVRLMTEPYYLREQVDRMIAEAEGGFNSMLKNLGAITSDDLLEKGGVTRLSYFKEEVAKALKKKGE